jgi:anaerobic ribonucleoside-triphosphate reductase activating protein
MTGPCLAGLTIQFGRLLSPVHSLGPGRRLVLWLQGCEKATSGKPCPECISRDLWDAGDGERRQVASLAKDMAGVIEAQALSGLTVTGGEPLDQYGQLICLLDDIAAGLEGVHRPGGLDTLLFTHHTQAEVASRFALAAERFDAMVCGEYRPELPSTAPLVASSNQRLVAKPHVAERYGRLDRQPRLQALVDNDDVVLAGIPLPGDIGRIEERLRVRGVSFSSVSWKE